MKQRAWWPPWVWVSNFKPGDRVTFDSTVYCGQCEFCRKGDINLCNNRQVIGVSCGDFRRAGRLRNMLWCRSASATTSRRAGVPGSGHAGGRFGCPARRAVSEMKGGETVLVIGAGMIGLLTLQAAKAAGAARVLVADIDQSRLLRRRRSAPIPRCCSPAPSWSRRSTAAQTAGVDWCSKR